MTRIILKENRGAVEMGNCCKKAKGPANGEAGTGPSEGRRSGSKKTQEPTPQDPNSLLRAVTTKDEFETVLKDAGSKLIVVDFYAVWCGPCKQIAPPLEKMAAEMPDVVFIKIDVDQADALADQYGINSMPTFMFFKESKMLTTLSGATPAKIRELIAEYNKQSEPISV